MEVRTHITAHHNGRFEFKICRIAAPAEGQTWAEAERAQLTPECFSQVGGQQGPGAGWVGGCCGRRGMCGRPLLGTLGCHCCCSLCHCHCHHPAHPRPPPPSFPPSLLSRPPAAAAVCAGASKRDGVTGTLSAVLLPALQAVAGGFGTLDGCCLLLLAHSWFLWQVAAGGRCCPGQALVGDAGAGTLDLLLAAAPLTPPALSIGRCRGTILT